VASGAPAAPPQAQPPNVTQNIFYISAPAPPPQPPPQQPPQEIHYHTTVHHAVRVRGPRHSLSFFGSAGVVLGGLAIAAAFVPQAAAFVRPLAMAGLAAAGFGLIVAILFGHSGKGVPVFGLLVSAAAWGLWLRNTGQLPPEMKKFEATVSNGIADIKLAAPNATAPKQAAKTPTPLPKPSVPTETPKPDSSIFNFEGDGNSPANVPSPAAAPRGVVASASPDLAAAKANLETARLAAAKRMGVDYATAKSNAERAWTDLQTSRSTFAAGSAELQVADQHWLDAKAVLEAIQRRLRGDPAVAAAEAKIYPERSGAAAKSKDLTPK
jgi:hypothetical protein